MQVGFDKEGRVLEHGVEEVERALQRRQVVQVGRDLRARDDRFPVQGCFYVSTRTLLFPVVNDQRLACSPAQAMRYGTSWCKPGSFRTLPNAASLTSALDSCGPDPAPAPPLEPMEPPAEPRASTRRVKYSWSSRERTCLTSGVTAAAGWPGTEAAADVPAGMRAVCAGFGA